MFRYLSFSFLLLLLSACGEPSAPTAPSTPDTPAASATAVSETDRINAWFDEKYEERLQFSPISMTFQGRKDRYDELDDYSLEAQDAQLTWMRASVEEMESQFDYDQ